ncbi:hypothetical protein DPX16_20099 [Anabarilius grahami]|uniref:Uncharacterized protein n=1 Tax=Anabarilius grahami TaxID=495550 RepID=A0A3N0XQS5_ANAGA|nr:hypothetical protein DPX16_20099 [Anabarilius grahami]
MGQKPAACKTLREYAGASGNLQTSRSCIAGGSCEAFSSESSEKKEAARSKTEFENEVGLWKCATIDLMSDEEDGIIGGVSGWIVRPPSFRSQELTERHAAVEIRGDSKAQGNAPQTSAKWTEFRQNAASYLQRRSGKQTFHGAVGFWASHQVTKQEQFAENNRQKEHCVLPNGDTKPTVITRAGRISVKPVS